MASNKTSAANDEDAQLFLAWPALVTQTADQLLHAGQDFHVEQDFEERGQDQHHNDVRDR